MKNLLIVLAIMMSTAVNAQSKFEISKDPNGSLIYEGEVAFGDILKEESFGWLKDGADKYQTDASAMAKLQPALKNYNIIVFMGTWCEDSHNLLPKFYKVLREVRYPMNKVRMYGVDRSKQLKGNEHKEYDINSVPTFIVLKGDEEIGRIVETVDKSIEADLTSILEDDTQD